jgi:hypothetical protein
MRSRSHLRTLVPLALLALAAGCSSAPKLPPGADNPGLAANEALKETNPLDVAVLRVENRTPRGGLPLDSLRKYFHAGLVERHYSPLALEFVDGNYSGGSATEASYAPGASDEQAVLKVVLTGWDDRLWKSHARLVIDADVWMIDARRSAGADPLWGGHVTRTMDMARLREFTAGDGPLLERTMEDFADQVLASLPARRPELASAR